MDELVTWLRGVLDEDQDDARDAIDHWVLADVEAKRAILDARQNDDIFGSERIQFPSWDSATCSDNCGPDVWWSVIRTLATAYAHRPGYREEWRP